MIKPPPWGIYEDESGSPHVAPIDDLLDHQLSRSCWCKPLDDEGIVVHNSADCREDVEGERIDH